MHQYADNEPLLKSRREEYKTNEWEGKKRRKSHIQYRTDNAIILITINQSPLHTRSGARIMTSRETGIYSVISCKLSGVPRGVFFFRSFHTLSVVVVLVCMYTILHYCIFIYAICILCSYDIFYV